MTDPTELIRQLVALRGPPGEERAVRDWLAAYLERIDYHPTVDGKGNLAVRIPAARAGAGRPAPIVITAHMDEIALMVSGIESDGTVRVAASGGAYTWKWGEGAVDILTRGGAIPAILSYGSIHTNSERSVAEYARHHALPWDRAYLFTGLSPEAGAAAGIRPGLRVVLAAAQRQVTEFGDFLASYFLDDRADLAVWLLALESLRSEPLPLERDLLFVATVSEEVGGDGAQYLLRREQCDICVALEIGPKTPEADFAIDAQPSIWVRDGYAAMEAIDGEILADCCSALGLEPHWQYLSRGGSDASCSASRGLAARPVTLALPVENSHGYEIMHRDAPERLTRLLLEYLRRAR